MLNIESRGYIKLTKLEKDSDSWWYYYEIHEIVQFKEQVTLFKSHHSTTNAIEAAVGATNHLTWYAKEKGFDFYD
jgi:hypothetical protein